ncbi:predicted protein [Plenodomus lingam JN3]|uniref:Predicted protein n=1 Tax=Leptosphaeria maculans (strain JN3 / isolate v23.1.3 / race Av1-4-5-6-7-8) TaxID=985895 RepID=E4ZN93_LEPMJ|nr:predicted protein [Plenodomus lingam JN3]CBX92952.1 predicted protein [Plenodomus lingam JN3]
MKLRVEACSGQIADGQSKATQPSSDISPLRHSKSPCPLLLLRPPLPIVPFLCSRLDFVLKEIKMAKTQGCPVASSLGTSAMHAIYAQASVSHGTKLHTGRSRSTVKLQYNCPRCTDAYSTYRSMFCAQVGGNVPVVVRARKSPEKGCAVIYNQQYPAIDISRVFCRPSSTDADAPESKGKSTANSSLRVSMDHTCIVEEESTSRSLTHCLHRNCHGARPGLALAAGVLFVLYASMLRCSVFEFSTLPTWRLWSSGTCNQTANLRPDQLMPSQSQFTANIPDRWPIICFDCEFQTSRPEGKGSTTYAVQASDYPLRGK